MQTYDNASSLHELQTTLPASVPENYTCYRCRAVAKHHINDCFAKRLTCNYCCKSGHLKNVCKQFSKQSLKQRSTTSVQARTVPNQQTTHQCPSRAPASVRQLQAEITENIVPLSANNLPVPSPQPSSCHNVHVPVTTSMLLIFPRKSVFW